MTSHGNRGRTATVRATHAPPRPTIWIVDDSPLESEKALRAIGDRADVALFDHGTTMLERLEREGPPDVLLLDWQLPEMSGIEICRFVRATYDEGALPVVMLTVFADKSDVAEALSAGANDYLTKPFDPIELAARLESALRTKRMFREARRAEEELQGERDRLHASEARFRRLADSGIIGIVQQDLSGKVMDANEAFLVMLGLSRADIAGGRVRMRELTPTEYLDADEAAARELVRSGVFTPYEKELLRSDGERIAVIQGGAVIDSSSSRCISYLLDVTKHRSVEADRARLYEAERKARAEAEAASRMKDDFLATVSHEIRTPLNAMLGWASMARGRPNQDPTVVRALETIERNAKAQAKLIDDILDVSRIVTGKIKLEISEVDFAELVTDAVDNLGPTAVAKGIALRCETSAGACTVAGDANRLQQVVWNLLNNAVKFTPRGGSVTVRVATLADAFELSVADTGLGLSAEFLPYVFDRFRQADASSTRRHGGLGLGLSIVRNLVELHGGQVSASSDGANRGATFRVELPRARHPFAVETRAPDEAESPAPSSVAEPSSLDGLRIVVVDDEVDSREVISSLLMMYGAIVVQAEDVERALEAIEKHRPDVLVSDIGMPVADGYALIRRLRARADSTAHTPAIAVTAYARAEDADRAITEGFQRHLAKPVDADKLVRAILELTRD